FSSSDNDILTGEDGDVYIGASFNMAYALTDVISFDRDKCEVLTDISMAWQVEEVETTYAYTENHIKSILIPQLTSLLDLEDDPIEQKALVNNISLWEKVVHNNDSLRKNSQYQNNRSFSAGAAFEGNSSIEDIVQTSYTFTVNTSAEYVRALQIAGGTFNETELGIKLNLSTSSAKDTIETTSDVETFGYVLDDDDVGDFFSVSIGEDAAHGSPIFRLEGGTSSCPQEAGTQSRDRAQILLDTETKRNVPTNEAANFIGYLSNLGESGEAREYQIIDVSSSNLDGAIITVGGTNVTGQAGSYFIPPGETLTTVISVERGPLAFDYEDLQLIMFPPCEYELWENNGSLVNSDTITFSVHFQSECSSIDLSFPEDEWRINLADSNAIDIALTGYDVNNDSLQDVRLQYREIGQNWNTAFITDKNLLVDAYFDYNFDVADLPDGEYQLRAVSNCGINTGISYSPIANGVIDRTTIAPFGSSFPNSGFLRKGEEIYAEFDQTIDCASASSQSNLTLINQLTGEAVPALLSCGADQLIITTDPPELINSLDSVMLQASVFGIQDTNGNVQEDTLRWSFIVNVSPVFWREKNLVASAIVGSPLQETIVLNNESTTTQSYQIIDHPDWITVDQLAGAILAESNDAIDISFRTDIDPGNYTGQIIALIDGIEEIMSIDYTLLPTPIGWQIDPSDYEHSMSITAQFSLDDSDTAISTSPRDIIGVFVNGRLRGFSNIEYVPSLDLHVAFITAYANEQGETLKFRFWDGTNGIEYGAKEEENFEVDGSIGTVEDPLILHSEGIFQIIPVTQGWNWISFNVTNDYLQDPTLALSKLFETLLSKEAGNELLIKSQTEFSEYIEATGWNGTLTTFNNEEGYLLYLSKAADTLRVIGQPIADQPSFPIGAGWNWVGYPLSAELSINEALVGFEASEQDLIKNQSTFASYSSNVSSWVGNLTNLAPGEAYKMRLAGDATIDFPASGRLLDGHNINPHSFEHNMIVIANLEVEGSFNPGTFKIIAEINGEPQGIGTLTYDPDDDQNRTYMMIYGNDINAGDSLSFSLINETEDLIGLTSDPIVFGIDANAGSSLDPLSLRLKIEDELEEEISSFSTILEQNYPNPFIDKTRFKFSIKEDQFVSIEMIDMAGRRIKTIVNDDMRAGSYSIDLDNSDLLPGVYMYKMETPSYKAVNRMVYLSR
ncbi:MAG: T9SS type A sorting domain-containing protein, partial [Cyclobacteriaceae bacterium]